MILPTVLAALAAASSSYSGQITFVGAETSGVAVTLSGTTATVTLGPAHVARAQVALRRSGRTVRFAAPGLPVPLVFTLRRSGTRLTGTATQGSARATVELTRGRRSPDTALGFYATPSFEVARFTRYGYGTAPLAVDLTTGAFGPVPALHERLAVH